MKSKISDNPQYKDIADQMHMIGCLSTWLPFLFTSDQRRELKNMREKVDELRRLPDEFNALFDCSTLNVPPISLSNVPGISE